MASVRARVVAVWSFVLLLTTTLVVGHRFHLPYGHGWLDTYVYARGATDFLVHPSHLYDAAMPQLHSASAQNAFIYPPSALIPFLPLVPLTRGLGVAWTAELWSWIDMVSLLAALVLIARQLGIGAERTAWILAGLMLCLPVLSDVDSGQVEGVILLLLTLSWRAFPRPSSGVLLGAALALKPVAPLLLLLPLAMRRPRVTLVAVGTLLLLNVPFLPFLGAGPTSFYFLHFLPYMGTHVMQDVANLSVANLLQTWLGGIPMIPADPTSVSPLHSVLLVDVVLWTLRVAALLLLARELLLRRQPPLVLFAMALAMVPLLAPIAWAHYYVFVLPAVLVLLTGRSVRARWITGASVVGCMLLNTMLDASTFHLAMYPKDLAQDASAANVLTVLQGGLLAAASVAVVFALGLARQPAREASAVRVTRAGAVAVPG
ncbi:MAG TPA: glycosyltransferase family 87 protein [Candidatus Angelobacter sp.]|jgi:alpha-1,2-mannosyltransferase|nr:glycosyltransferase family 87 protein [Candidatus Angelobacter sp.]